MSRIALSLLALLLATAAHGSTILNTLQNVTGSGPGWSGGLDGMWSAEGGNTEKIQFDAGGQLQWQGERNRLRLQLSGEYEEVSTVVTSREWVAHLRHSHALGTAWSTIAFAQVQTNSFQDLTSRWLFGAGARWDVLQSERGRVSLGATPMIEIERLADEEGRTTRGRLSMFLSLSRRLSESAALSATGFWQPLFADLGDMRAVGNLALTVDVIGEVDLKVGVEVEYDSSPPADIEKTDWTTYVGFEIDV